jgi:hypothetical protein
LQGYFAVLNEEQLLGLARRLRLLPCPEEIAAEGEQPSVILPPGDATEVAPGNKRARGGDGTAKPSATSLEHSDGVIGLKPALKHFPDSREFTMDTILSAHKLRPSQVDAINRLPLYPDEQVLWDANVVPSSTATGTKNTQSYTRIPLYTTVLH